MVNSIDVLSHVIDSIYNIISSGKRIRLSNTTEISYVILLCHINLNRIQKFVKDGPLTGLELESKPTCKSCI